jgi:adenosylcobalamin-dependent ribonucleoside-triphosphate reductase
VQVKKRDGRLVEFNTNRIINAIEKAMAETKEGINKKLSKKISENIKKEIEHEDIVTVENIQDIIENKLMSSNKKDVAKKYILYREYRNQNRGDRPKYRLLDDDFIANYKHKPSPMNPLGEFTYYRTYSRWFENEKRREYWWETVRRSVEFNCNLVDGVLKEEAQKLYDNIYNLYQFLSGRTFWIGGTKIAYEYPCSNYNCAFVIIDNFEKFKELFYLLMIGSGVGFRILKSDVEKLPPVRTNVEIIQEDYNPVLIYEREDNTSLEFINNIVKITIGDSKEGWIQALEYYFKILYNPEYKKIKTIIINYNNVRKKGEKLKRFGGTASGHESIKNMFVKITNIIHKLNNENGNKIHKLRPIHCLDICNIIGENVVTGGVRRTAEVGLIDENDKECIEAKNGLYYQNENEEWVENTFISHRKMSNNSIIYRKKPSREQLHWQIKQMKYSGEPGFMNLEAAQKRKKDVEGANPCLEILLRDRGLCNLTTHVMPSFVKNCKLLLEKLKEAITLSVRASIRMTCLPLELYEWDKIQKEDRLLGISLTGWYDAIDKLNYTTEQEIELANILKETAKAEAEKYSKELNIPTPKLVTTIKPEGTLSLLAGVSNGLHRSHSEYYIRRIRISANDPLVKVCEELGYPVSPENGQDLETCNTKVISFPVHSSAKITKYDVTAIQQLETYKMFMQHYVEHNASITVTVKNNEWEEVEQWVWDNWDEIVAVSFLSLDDNFYPQAPYESITKEKYEELEKNMKPFIPSLLSKYEMEEIELDLGETECTSGACPVR